MNKTELTIQEIHTVTLNVLQTLDLFRGMMMQTFGCQEKTMTDFWIIAKRTRTR